MSEWKKKRSIMRRYDLTAHIYDMRYAEEQTAKIKAALEGLNIEGGSLVLDVGCGTGILFDYITDKAMTVGLDVSRKLLITAKERAKKFKDVHLVLADADNMPFRQNVFTYVFAFTVVQNMPNPAATLNEIRRIAKRNAIIVISGLKRVFSKNVFEELLRSARLRSVVWKDEGLKCYVAVCVGIC